MNVKLFEIRDSGTFIVAFAFRPLATSPSPSGRNQEEFLLRRGGWGEGATHSVYLGDIQCREIHYDPYDWRRGSRTMQEAHHYIAQHFDELASGTVIDVQFILGETKVEKESERLLEV
jgi:hypothetical protein